MTGKVETQRYYSARLAFDYLRGHLPAQAITQNNPQNFLDRGAGLYGSRQMVVADRTALGIQKADFEGLVVKVGNMFRNIHTLDWQPIDAICQEYSIDTLIIQDTDPVWWNLPILKLQRSALYENAHYALFACGRFVLQ